MTVAGHFEEYGIVIEVWKPTITVSGSNVLYEPEGEFVGTIQDKVSAYSHTLGVWGGYLGASISITDREEEIDEWFSDGLGRHIKIYNRDKDPIWEGYVDSLNGALETLAFVRGPLQDIANRVSVIYQLINRTVNPPIDGMRVINAIAEDSDSQLTWGIFEKIFNGPGMSATEALQVRDKFLKEKKDPETSKTLGGESNVPNVTLGLLGYIHFLKTGIYNQTTNSGTTTLSVKLEDILDDGGADPNTLFSSANAEIEANAILVQRYENDNNVPLNLIKSLVAQGEPVNDLRTLFGVFENRKVVYETMPQTIEYIRRLKGPKLDVMTQGEEIIYPWDVKAGKWLQIIDFMLGETDQQSDFRLDPRMMFLEQVAYTAPWGLDLQGGKTSTFPQRLAQLGVGGTSA
jgi:hypothetical protein